jgi:hypothetical protein
LSKFWRIELPTNGLPLFAAQNLFNSSNDSCLSSKSWNIRVIRKVRKTQHQNPEFGNTQDEIQKKNTCKKVRLHSTGDETQKTINFGGKLSFILSFLFPEKTINFGGKLSFILSFLFPEKTINFGDKLSFILSFLFPEHHLHCCYIYFHCS